MREWCSSWTIKNLSSVYIRAILLSLSLAAFIPLTSPKVFSVCCSNMKNQMKKGWVEPLKFVCIHFKSTKPLYLRSNLVCSSVGRQVRPRYDQRNVIYRLYPFILIWYDLVELASLSSWPMQQFTHCSRRQEMNSGLLCCIHNQCTKWSLMEMDI